MHISSARRSVGIIYAVIDCKFYVRIDCSCAQHAWYDDKMENSSYKRPWIATNGQATAARAPLGSYGLG